MADSTRRWQFFKKAWAFAFQGAWGLFGTISTLAGVVLPAAAFFASRWPKGERGMVATILTHPAIPDVVWFIPIFVALPVFVVRLFIFAPYRIFKEEEERRQAAERKLVPSLRTMPQHSSAHQYFVTSDDDQTPTNEYHRVFVCNDSITPIDDVRAYLHAVNGRGIGPAELQVMNLEPRPVRLFHGNPVGFDLIVYTYGMSFQICSRAQPLSFESGHDYHFTVVVVGSGTVSVRVEVSVSGGYGPGESLTVSYGGAEPLPVGASLVRA